MTPLDEHLRDALLQYADDAVLSVDTTSSASELQDRLDREETRRRVTTWLVAAAAVVVVAGAALGIAGWLSSRHVAQPAGPPQAVQTQAWSLPGGPVAVFADTFTDGSGFWVALRDDHALVQWSSTTGTTSTRVPLPGSPVTLTAAEPYIALLVKNGTASTLVLFDRLNKTVTATLPLSGDVVAIKSTADNKSVVYLDRAGDVGIVDVVAHRITVTGPDLGSVGGVPAGSRLVMVGNLAVDPLVVAVGEKVVFLNPRTLAVLSELPLGSTVVGLTHGSLNEAPWLAGLTDGRVLAFTEEGSTSKLADTAAGTPWPQREQVWVLGTQPAVLVDMTGHGIVGLGGAESAGATYATQVQSSMFIVRPQADEIVRLTLP